MAAKQEKHRRQIVPEAVLFTGIVKKLPIRLLQAPPLRSRMLCHDVSYGRDSELLGSGVSMNRRENRKHWHIHDLFRNWSLGSPRIVRPLGRQTVCAGDIVEFRERVVDTPADHNSSSSHSRERCIAPELAAVTLAAFSRE